jgi:hypothetical protein
MSLLPEGQIGETLNLPEKQCPFRTWEAWIDKYSYFVRLEEVKTLSAIQSILR